MAFQQLQPDMSTNPETLSVFAAEEIKIKDVPPGTPTPTPEQQAEKLPPEEIEKRQKIMLEYIRLSGRYCNPHNLKSRWVTTSDLPMVLADGLDMVAMCNLPRGKYGGGAAIAHSQIEDKDPLRFFVLSNGTVIVNPIIINHTKSIIERVEGCLSFPNDDMKKNIPRYNKITVTYQTLVRVNEKSEPILSKPITEGMGSGIAHVFQHEVSHLNGISIYDDNFTPESCIGFGDGPVGEEEIKKLYE